MKTMKKNHFTKLISVALTTAVMLLSSKSNAQPWSVSTTAPAICARTIEAKDIIYSNGYIYTAGTKYNNAGHLDLFVSKTDLTGVVQTTTFKDYNNNDDIPVKIKKDASGNIYVLSTATYGSNDRDFWLVKYDANLVLIWNTSYHFADEVAVDMIVSGSTIYITGNSISTAKGSDIALVKFSTAGVLSGSTRFSFGTNTDTEAAKEMVFDGTYLYICGYRDTSVSGRDGVILKYNTSLILQWSKAWSPALAFSNEAFNSLVINGSYLYAGGSGWSLSTKNDFLLAKFNKSTGAFVSKTTSNSTSNNDEIRKVCTFGSEIYVTGITETSTSPLKNKVITSKFTTALAQVAPWPLTYKPSTDNYECNDMKINNYGTVAIAGTVKKTSISGIAYTASFTLIYNSAGIVLEAYATPNNTGCNTVESSGNAVVFTDPNYDFNIAVAGGNRAWFSTIECINAHRIEITSTLLRPASNDLIDDAAEKRTEANETNLQEVEFNAFPNPAFNELHVTGNAKITGYFLMDLNGNVLKTELTNQKDLLIDISRLAPGSYLISIDSDSGKTTKRFIKM